MQPRRVILHIDMDAFFASVEQRDDAALRGKPVLVGGRQGRGVVCAASYEARAFGCRAAMPMMNALRLCPHAAVVPPNFAAYTKASRAMHKIFDRYSPQIEPLSLDEAFVDVTASLAIFGSARLIGEGIRAAVRDELQLTCSVGIASNKFAAKIASDIEKPNAIVEFDDDTLAARLATLKVERMWGVGPIAAQELRARGFELFADLQRASEQELALHFGDTGRAWHRLSYGIDDRPVEASRIAKSVGEEETFAEDVLLQSVIEAKLLEQADEVSARLRAIGLYTRTATIKIRFSNFETHTHSRTLTVATDHTHELRVAARELLASFAKKHWRAVRLCGFHAGNLVEMPGQLPLFGNDKRDKLSKLDDVRDAIARRHAQSGSAADSGNAAARAARVTRDDRAT